MTNSIRPFAHDTLTILTKGEAQFNFSNNSEAKTSELLENIEEM